MTAAHKSVGRAELLDQLRRHLSSPDTGGAGRLQVVVAGMRLEVELRATKLHTGPELEQLRAQLQACLEEHPWRFNRGLCQASTSRKSSPWSKHAASCSRPIAGAVAYRGLNADADAKTLWQVRFWFHCASHEAKAGVEPASIVGRVPISKEMVKRYIALQDAHQAKQRSADAAAAVGCGGAR